METKSKNWWIVFLCMCFMGTLPAHGADGVRILAFAALPTKTYWTVWVFNDGQIDAEIASYELFVRGATDREGPVESIVHSPGNPETLKRGQFIGVFGFKARPEDVEYGPRTLRIRFADGCVRDVPVIVEGVRTPTKP